MGIFNRPISPEEGERRRRVIEDKTAAWRAKLRADDKLARRAARKSKFPVEGAQMVLHAGTYQEQCLVLREGQVEYYTKESGFIQRNSGVQRTWVASGDSITSVTCSPRPPLEIQRAITAKSTLVLVTVHGSVNIKGGALQVDYCVELIEGLRTSGRAPSQSELRENDGKPTPPREALKDLAALLQDGLITEDEFQWKRAEILARM